MSKLESCLTDITEASYFCNNGEINSDVKFANNKKVKEKCRSRPRANLIKEMK
jgi:hypothetical protein